MQAAANKFFIALLFLVHAGNIAAAQTLNEADTAAKPLHIQHAAVKLVTKK